MDAPFRQYAFCAAPSDPEEVERRRSLGQVFTPPGLVNFILDQAGYQAGSGLLDRSFLEPACGDGAFLVAAAGRLADELELSGTSLHHRKGGKALIDAMQQCLIGVDIDSVASELAIQALGGVVLERTGMVPPVGFMARNIVTADFLFATNATRCMFEAGFDFIVGNPPYVPTTQLGDAYKDDLRRRYTTATGRIDLYGVFIEHAVNKLRPGGRLSFIVPDKFLANQSGGPLRKFLSKQGAVVSLCRFDSHKVFESAATVPCVLVYEKAGIQKAFASSSCAYTDSGGVAVLDRAVLSSSRLTDSGWFTNSNVLETLGRQIAGEHPRLGELSHRISAGLATGKDSVFVVPASVAENLDQELLRPAIRGRDLSPFAMTDPHLFIILPYAFPKGERPTLLSLSKFRRTLSYLAKFRTDLEARHAVRKWEKAWFDLHDPVPSDLAGVPKILVPDVAESPRFVFDEGRFCPLHSAYYIIPDGVDGVVAAAILNSKPIEFLLRLRTPLVKDGFNRYRRQFLLDLPIPRVSAEVARQIKRAVGDRDSLKLDSLSARLFNLADHQWHAIEDHLSNLPHRLKKASRVRES